MQTFDIELLHEVMQKFNKQAFVASPQTQEAISSGQQQGALPPPAAPTPGTGEQPQIGFPELAQLIQQGLEGIMQGMQQLAQMVQQSSMDLQTMKMSGGKEEKKKSVAERLDQLEQMFAQATGGSPAPETGEQPTAAQGQPAEVPPGAEQPPQ